MCLFATVLQTGFLAEASHPLEVLMSVVTVSQTSTAFGNHALPYQIAD